MDIECPKCGRKVCVSDLPRDMQLICPACKHKSAVPKASWLDRETSTSFIAILFRSIGAILFLVGTLNMFDGGYQWIPAPIGIFMLSVSFILSRLESIAHSLQKISETLEKE